ncbi:hypothetical protein [Pedobacter sp. KBW06]|uniref:hypothetical protein n=1 Tax=Pedobacter sp. KBW06 TaxID=2153359 RepID=UPI000F59E75F|nr:hypothetical protein [Pedobacter sp. KBW06]
MKKLSELSLNELVSRKSTIKACLIAFAILGVLATLTLIFLKAKPILFVALIPLLITWLPILISLKSINDEIKLRNSKNPVTQ